MRFEERELRINRNEGIMKELFAKRNNSSGILFVHALKCLHEKFLSKIRVGDDSEFT